MAQSEQITDLDALQAQIDLSMSITEQLVSSWISASPKASIISSNVPRTGSSSNVAGPSNLRAHEKLEKELEEYLRRPPRLGVGAPIPESSSAAASREAARLKQKLGATTGSKRKRDNGEEVYSTLSKSTGINGVPASTTRASKHSSAANNTVVHSHERGLSDDDREERKGATDRAAGKKAKMFKSRLDPFALGVRESVKGKGKVVVESDRSTKTKDPAESKDSVHVENKEKGKERSVEALGHDEVAPKLDRPKSGLYEYNDMDMDFDKGSINTSLRSPFPNSDDATKFDRNRDHDPPSSRSTNGDVPSARNYFSNSGTQQPSSTASAVVSAARTPIHSQVTFTPTSATPTALLQLNIPQKVEKTTGSVDKGRGQSSAESILKCTCTTAENGIGLAEGTHNGSNTVLSKMVIGSGVSRGLGDDNKNGIGSQPAQMNEAKSNVNDIKGQTSPLSETRSKKKRKKRRKADETDTGSTPPTELLASGIDLLSCSAATAKSTKINSSSNNNNATSAIVSPSETTAGTALNKTGSSNNTNATNSGSSGGMYTTTANSINITLGVNAKNTRDDRGPQRDAENSLVTLLSIRSDKDMNNVDDDNHDNGNNAREGRDESRISIETRVGVEVYENESDNVNTKAIGAQYEVPTTPGHVDHHHHPPRKRQEQQQQVRLASNSEWRRTNKKSKRQKRMEREKRALEVQNSNKEAGGVCGASHAPRLSLSVERTTSSVNLQAHTGQSQHSNSDKNGYSIGVSYHGEVEEVEWIGFTDEDD